MIFRKIFRLFLFTIALFLGSQKLAYGYSKTPLNQDNSFQVIDGSTDIPLSGDLHVDKNNSVNFDSFNGSIISISYKTTNDLPKIKDFYLKTLPQMGWEIISNEFMGNSDIVDFKRDDETLEIEFVKNENSEEKLVNFFAKLKL